MATISDLCGAQTTRATLMNCARSAKRQGNAKDMRHFLRGARRWHAKVMRLIQTVPQDELAHFYGWRIGPVKVADGSGWWIDEAKPRTIKKLPAFDPAKLAKAQVDRAEVAKLLGWA